MEGDQHLLEKYEYSEKDKIRILALLSLYNVSTIPSGNNIEVIIKDVAKVAAIYQPHIYLHGMNEHIKKRGNAITTFVKLFEEEQVFRGYLDDISPNGEEIIKKLRIHHIEDPVLKAKEEEIVEYLKCFLYGNSKKAIATFVRFVTGCDTVANYLHVYFNTQENENLLLPKSNTCSESVFLDISRYLSSQHQFDFLMMQALSSGLHWGFYNL